MPDSRAGTRHAIVVLAVVLGGCAAKPQPQPPLAARPVVVEPAAVESDVPAALILMEEAQAATGEDWTRLHRLLATAAAMNPVPRSRARVALALSQGQRSSEELERALTLMDDLLREQHATAAGPDGAQVLPPDLRRLVALQRAQLARRLDRERALARMEHDMARVRTRLAHEIARHARARGARDAALAELDGARERLRAVTRIELKHESSGG